MQKSLNILKDDHNAKGTDYKGLLTEREGERQDARRNWKKIANIKDISYIVTNNNAKIIIQGEGYVSEFSPQAGSVITNDSIIRLILEAPKRVE